MMSWIEASPGCPQTPHFSPPSPRSPQAHPRAIAEKRADDSSAAYETTRGPAAGTLRNCRSGSVRPNPPPGRVPPTGGSTDSVPTGEAHHARHSSSGLSLRPTWTSLRHRARSACRCWRRAAWRRQGPNRRGVLVDPVRSEIHVSGRGVTLDHVVQIFTSPADARGSAAGVPRSPRADRRACGGCRVTALPRPPSAKACCSPARSGPTTSILIPQARRSHARNRDRQSPPS